MENRALKRKRSKPYTAPQIHISLPIREICGAWKSLCGSPSLKIYHDGSRFRLQFAYKQDTAFTVPLYQRRGITFFYFYGMITITYDDEHEKLQLSTEGEYEREYD